MTSKEIKEKLAAEYWRLDQELVIDVWPDLRVRIQGKNRTLYDYNGAYYEPVDENAMLARIDKELVARGLTTYRTRSNRKDILARVSCLLESNTLRHMADTPATLLNFTNGLFDFKENVCMDHSPSLVTTAQLPYAFDGTATAPTWDLFIKDVTLGDERTSLLLQEIMGYCLTNRTDQQKAFFLYGPTSGNGKSTFQQVLRHVVGETTVSTLNCEQLMTDKLLHKLINKNVNVIEEINERYIESDRIKSVISGEAQLADPKYEDPILFEPTVKLLFCGNTRPKFRDNAGLLRRLIFIRFAAEFRDGNRIVDYYKHLITEAPGILNWALDGLARLDERGRFTMPEQSLREAQDYEVEGSSFMQFIEEMVYLTDDDEQCFTARQLYGTQTGSYDTGTGYLAYCAISRTKPYGFRRFANELSAYAKENADIHADKRQNLIVYTNLALRTPGEVTGDVQAEKEESYFQTF